MLKLNLMKIKLLKGIHHMNSWWNSIELVGKYNFILQILSISFLFLSLLAGAISLKFSMRISDLQKYKDIKATEEDSNRAIEINTLKNELSITKNELDTAKTKLDKRISDAEVAIKPIPFTERLRQLLSTIDPKILPSLKAGNTNFSGGITATQFNDLQKIAKETGANKYITISPDVNMGLGMGVEGVTYGVKFILNPSLITD